ncbi:MAG: TonB-dependent receptor [Gemmatimonadota bacterium]
MTCRSVGATLLTLVLVLTRAAQSQNASGKIEGRVRDSQGQVVAAARVVIPGTAFGTVTSSQGYFFFNTVPPGSISLRASAIGYRSLEIRDIRILAGQTVTQDMLLESAPLEIEAITVRAAENPLVPRDAVTTLQRAQGDFVDRLPVDRITDVLTLQPGVTATSRGEISIRGGRPDESVVYIDGVPVSPGFRLNTPGFLGIAPTTVEVGIIAFEEVSVTTGALSAEYGNAQSGIIAVQTRSGGPQLAGHFGYETDELLGVGHGLGLNRFEGSLGGPVAGRLHFFLSGVVQGQRSAEGGWHSEKAPLFLAVGIDTTVAVPSAAGDPVADTTYQGVSKFAVARGECAEFRNSTNAVISNNAGIECGSVRIPWSFGSSYQALGKLAYGYGTGSRIALSLQVSQNQNRDFDYGQAFAPLFSGGHRESNQVLTAQWTQNLTRAAERALSFNMFLSYQKDRSSAGPLTPSGELESRDPVLGIRIKPLDFLFDFDNFPVTEKLVRNFLRQQGVRSPLDLDHPDQYRSIDNYRNNPYGLQGFRDGGGPDGFLFLQEEHRSVGRGVLDWQADRYNRIRAGVEGIKYYIGFYGHDLLGSGAADIWIRRPYRWNVFVEDRLDLGDLIVVGGLRYDRYNSNGRAPVWFDSTSGRFEYFPRISTNPDFQFDNPDAVFRPYRSHGYLSPHIQVSFPVTSSTNFRFSYAHQVQVPDFAAILRRANTDFSLSQGLYGSDLDFTRTITFEFGIRHSFGPDMVLDIAAYNKNKLSDVTGRSIPIYDPFARTLTEVQRMTTADFGIIRGVDLRLDRRIGNLLNGVLSYTYQTAKNTGDDPLSYLNRQSVLVSNATGINVLPPQAILTTRDSRPQNFAGALALQFPSDWQQGRTLGSILGGTGLYAVFRYASGTAYTRCAPVPGNESFTSSGGGCSFQAGLGEFNGARLPAVKQFDLRLTRGFRVGSMDATVYLDARNLLNFRNVLEVFSAYHGVVSRVERNNNWAADSSGFAAEAEASGVLDTLGRVDLRFGGAVASGCGNWVRADLSPAPPNCVYLIRAEERYGNGDHIFDVAEMRRASDALYEVNRGIQTFTDAPRRMRVGMEVNF